MIDIGFGELGLIGLVLLLVVGPKRLPSIVRRAGYWVAKVRKLKQSLQEESERLLQKQEEDDKSDGNHKSS